MEEKVLNILIAAGGTGGHLFPAMAVAEQLKKITDNNINIQFIGTANRIEAQIVPKHGYVYHTMPIIGLGGSTVKSLMLPWLVMESIMKARSVIKTREIDAVIGAGAYITYPPGIAAWQLNKPLFLMESNVNPGKSNKKLSTKAKLIFTAFNESSSFFPPELQDRLRAYGNPVREFIQNLPSKEEARANLGLDLEKKTVFIMGGSLGARSINQAVEKYLIDFEGKDYQIYWQTGKNYIPPTTLPENVTCTQFIDDMASAYSAADLVVSRSGATSAAELMVALKPSILVPMPSASNNEQYYNAKVLDDNKAAIMIDDSQIGDMLFSSIENLIYDSERLQSFSDQARRLGKPDAAYRVANEILQSLNYKPQEEKSHEEEIPDINKIIEINDENINLG